MNEMNETFTQKDYNKTKEFISFLETLEANLWTAEVEDFEDICGTIRSAIEELKELLRFSDNVLKEVNN